MIDKKILKEFCMCYKYMTMFSFLSVEVRGPNL